MRALLAAETKAFRAEDWRAGYDLGSPRARDVCTYHDYLDDASAAGILVQGFGYKWSDFGARDVKIVVDGNNAKVTYTATLHGHDFFTVEDNNADTAVYADGQWWDDNKGHSSCR